MMKKYLVVLVILLGLLTPSASSNTQSTQNVDAIPILLYHNLTDGSGPQDSANLDVSVFKQQMQYLYDNGYTTITPAELQAWMQGELRLPQKTVMITFDDGYESVYILGYPILKQYGFKATVFIVTRSIADYGNHVNFPHMSWAQMNTASDVFTYGSHTDSLHYVKHCKFYLFYVDNNTLITDLIKSRKIMNSTPYFAYPYGGHDARITAAVKKAGYSMAWTTQERYVYVGDSMYAIPRFSIGANTTMAQFVQILEGSAWPRLRPAHMKEPKRTLIQ